VRVARLLQPQLDLRRRYHTFRQIRIERAGADILCLGQFLPREVFRLQLAAKRFGRSREGSFPVGNFMGSNETYQVSWGLTAMGMFS
jgi:hypothetical protein